MACEFKEVKNQPPVQAIGKVVDEYVVAYLNTAGGSIFWGIRNDGLVLGVPLHAEKRDEISQIVGNKIASIASAVSPETCDLPFHPVLSAVDTSVPVEHTFVVEVLVRRPKGNLLHFTGNSDGYRKTLGGIKKLIGAELLNALLEQLESKLKQLTKEESSDDLILPWLPSVARRAKYVRPLLRGARALWVDDTPRNNLYERTVLASLDISVDLALSTEDALYMTSHLPYDLILSDMSRAGNPAAGLELLDQLRRRNCTAPVVFYAARYDRWRPVPVGAFGMTNRADDLLHYVFDVLDRRTPSVP